MAIEQAIEISKTGRVHTFTFTHDTVVRFEQVGELSKGIDNIITNMLAYIKTCIIDEGSMSESKAKKILDEICDEYDIVDVYGVLANKHAEVFIGGENDAPKKKLSK